MAKVRLIPKFGDVIEIPTEKGLGYVQYTAKHTDPPVFGELVRVFSGLHDERPSEFSTLAKGKESYFIFTPISAVCRKKQASIVSNEPIPDWAQGIPLMRIAGLPNAFGTAQDWYLWDGLETWPANQSIDELRKLSIAEIWGHDVLVERLIEGWSPANEPNEHLRSETETVARGNDPPIRSAILAARRLGIDANLNHDVTHYMYFPSKKLAEETGKLLSEKGYSIVVERQSESWVVKASARNRLDEKTLSEIASDLTNIAASKKGEYDGWEVRID